MTPDRIIMDQKATETTAVMEPIATVKFKEKMLTGSEPARCVDGRPSPGSQQGPQMLGGSLHPILLDAISQQKDFNETTVAEDLKTLQGAGLKTGAQRGKQKSGEASDCVFADRLPDIIKTATDRRGIITDRLTKALVANRARLNGLMPASPKDFIDAAF